MTTASRHNSKAPLLQNFDLLQNLFQQNRQSDIISFLNRLHPDELWFLLPSYTNNNELSYPLLFWCIIFQAAEVLDYLVKKQSVCILHSKVVCHKNEVVSTRVDALTFAIKMNKHEITDHLILNYHWSFDLIRGPHSGSWSSKNHHCEDVDDDFSKQANLASNSQMMSYQDLLDYSHQLEAWFSKSQNSEAYLKNKQTLECMTRFQNNCKVYITDNNKFRLQNKLFAQVCSQDIAKYINYDLFLK